MRAQQSTGTKIVVVSLPILGVVLIGVVLYVMSQKKVTESK